ncbi:MAG: hypothetical protein AAF321_02580, partial [Pseudomonadota bacterium]
MPDFQSTYSATDLNGTNGFRIGGISELDALGWSVSSAGDLNGDGIADVIIGAPGRTDSLTGEAYVVFGTRDGFEQTIRLADDYFDGTNGFLIDGINAGDRAGWSVSGAGDLNGDGIADIVIGAPQAELRGGTSFGESYVIFGKTETFDARVTLGNNFINGANGFRIDGINVGDQSGWSVSDAGDVNGDGIADIIIGAPFAELSGDAKGESYVIFGNASGFAQSVTLGNNFINGTNGFRIDGINDDDRSGFSVSGAGDVNGDGIADIIIGAPEAELRGGTSFVESYVIFGSASGFPQSVTLGDNFINGTNGFRIDGINENDRSGSSVSAAGDVNGDGIDDIIIGAPEAELNGNNNGEAYVIFGKTESFGQSVTLNDSFIDGTNGFRIDGLNDTDLLGGSVSAAGDVNGDGFDDIIIGAPSATNDLGNNSGEAYVIFGKATGFAQSVTVDSAFLDGVNGFRIRSIGEGDEAGASVSGAGDLNGDGFDDIIVGARLADPNGIDSGGAYVIYGVAPTEAVSRTGSAASQTIRGGAFNDQLSGLGGADTLISADGADTLLGGEGNDALFSGGGNDTALGGEGDDLIFGGLGDDATAGGAGNDRMFGGAGDDGQAGGTGNDTIGGAAGNDQGFGAAGEDRLFGSSGSDTLYGGADGDKLFGGLDNDTLAGGTGDDEIGGGFGDDEIAAGGGADTIFGGVGDDVLFGAGGADSIFGGAGNDQVFLGNSDGARDVYASTA